MVLEQIGIWMAQNIFISSLIVLIISFYILTKASDYIVIGITGYSEKLGLSDSLIGFLVISMATTLPEFVSSIMGNQAGEPGIVFGTIIGSGITTVTIVLGTLALIGKRINLSDELIGKIRPMIMPLCVLPLILLWDGELSRVDGGILLLAFFAFVIILWKEEGTFGNMKEDVKIRHIYKDVIIFLVSLAALLLAARFMVFSSIVLSHEFKIPTYIMALTVIAIGASVGDFMLDIRSLLKGRRNIAVGDALGGIILGNTLTLGVVALIQPIKIDVMTLVPGYFFFLVPLMGALSLIKKGYMTRKHGVWLLSTYVAFLIVQVLVLR